MEGEWLWTTRPGSERDLVDEITMLLGPERARVLGPALVRSQGAPTAQDGPIDLVFARQGFRIAGEIVAPAEERAAQCAAVLARLLGGDARPWALSGWVPDTEALNPLSAEATALEERVGAALAADPAIATRRVELRALPRTGGVLAQLALVGPDRVIVGAVDSERALTLAPGGRSRMRVRGDRPSRAARKIEEAFAWLGVAPGPGDVCVDLGAAPGGWTWALLERRAKVIAVDPAELRLDLDRVRARNLVHHPMSAFQFTPEEPVDWLFCDMAWRPLEVAQLLAKWARRRWARILVANLKLPMRKKAAMVEDLRQVLAGGGWQRIRARQLYHDRAEVTVTAFL